MKPSFFCGSGGVKEIFNFSLCLLAFFFAFNYAAQGIEPEDLLKPEEAFRLTVQASDADTLVATWSIADGYYLYRERFRFKSATPDIQLGEARFPRGSIKEDKFFGLMEIYKHRVSVEIPIVGNVADSRELALAMTYQGCAEVGVCYPPETRTVTVELPLSNAGNFLSASDIRGSLLEFGQSRQEQLLAPNEAFILSVTAPDPQTLVIRWDIADGYYLYRDKLQIGLLDAGELRIASLEIPPGMPQEDEFFGEQAVFYQQATVTAHLQGNEYGMRDFAVQVDYQGCAEVGVCYPPMSQTIPVTLGLASAFPESPEAAITTTEVPMTAGPVEAEQDRIARLLQEQRFWALPAFFGFGLLLAFTPCIFPMIPILSGLIVGQGRQLNRRRAFLLSSVYVLAMALTYTLAGILAALLGQNIQALFQNPWIIGGFSLLFVLLALSMFGLFNLQIPARWQSRLTELSNRQRGGRYTGVAVMGLLSALIVGPCVAPPLIGVLAVIGATGDTVLGGTALFILSLGMGAPLIVLGASAGHLLPRAGHWMHRIKAIFGVLLLAVSIWLLERILPATVVMLLWATLLIVSAIYMGALQSSESSSPWRPLVRGLGMVMLIYGILLLVGVAAGGRDPLQPLRGVSLMAGSAAHESLEFRSIDTMAQLNQALDQARGRPVMVDFYADWCVSCKELEKYTFSDPAVQRALNDTVLLKIDVTANNAEDQALLRRFGLIGPPAILFFGPDGIERPAYRLVGFIPADAFRRHLDQALRPQDFLAGKMSSF